MRHPFRLSAASRRRPLVAAAGVALALTAAALLAPGCEEGADEPTGPAAGFESVSCADFAEPCLEVASDDVTTLYEETNLLADDTTVVLGAGTFTLDNQVTIRDADGVTLVGQGIDATVLSFATQTVQSNGVDVVGDRFRIEGLTIADATKDALRVEDSVDVTIRAVKTTWSGEPSSDNGAYGLYPVRCEQVLMEDCEAWNASDAGIYVGQSRHVIVRNNLATQNVAGLEIENTQYADVYDNVVEDNTCGLVVFDLPGNPVVGRDVLIHDNVIRNNNRFNFAPGGVVLQVPPGTGTFAMASRRVEITGNAYEDNKTVDVAVISGLAIESDADKWFIATEELVGDTEGLVLDAGEGGLYNHRSTEVYVHGNTHSGGGLDPQGTVSQPLGILLKTVYGDNPADTFMYDAIGESGFSTTEPSVNTNDNHICFAGDNATYASLDLATLIAKFDQLGQPGAVLPAFEDLYRPDAPWAPFDCAGFTEGPVVAPTMPAGVR